MADNARIDDLRKRLEKEPGSRLFAQLAEELRKNGDFEEAIAVSRAGLEKQPAYSSARMTLGRALQDSGDLKGALPEFEAVLKGAPDNILASRLLGECLEGTGDLAGAARRYRATLVLSPGDKQVQARLEAVEKLAASPAAAAPAAPSAPPAAPAAGPPPGGPDTAALPVVRALPANAPIPLVEAEESFELEAPYAVHGFPTEPMQAPPRPSAPAAPPVPPPPPTPFGLPVREVDFDFEPESPTVVMGAPAAEPEFVAPPFPPPAAEATAPEPPPVVEPPAFEALPAEVEPEPEPEPAPELASSTLAELYFNQGHTERAIDVYRQLLEREPSNERARARLTELVALESHLKAEEQRGPASAASSPLDPRAARRAAIERTIARLEALLASIRRE